jgi:hypothetical protein
MIFSFHFFFLIFLEVCGQNATCVIAFSNIIVIILGKIALRTLKIILGFLKLSVAKFLSERKITMGII